MSRERVARAATGRFIPMIMGLSTALGNDPMDALAYQQLYFRSWEYEDGWVPMSDRQLSSEIACTRYAAGEALKKLEEEEVLERRPGAGNRPDSYRPRQDVLLELLPHDASCQPQFVADLRPPASSPERDSDRSLSHAHANEGRRRKEERSEGAKERKEDDQHVGSEERKEDNSRGESDSHSKTDSSSAGPGPESHYAKIERICCGCARTISLNDEFHYGGDDGNDPFHPECWKQRVAA